METMSSLGGEWNKGCSKHFWYNTSKRSKQQFHWQISCTSQQLSQHQALCIIGETDTISRIKKGWVLPLCSANTSTKLLSPSKLPVFRTPRCPHGAFATNACSTLFFSFSRCCLLSISFFFLACASRSCRPLPSMCESSFIKRSYIISVKLGNQQSNSCLSFLFFSTMSCTQYLGQMTSRPRTSFVV